MLDKNLNLSETLNISGLSSLDDFKFKEGFTSIKPFILNKNTYWKALADLSLEYSTRYSLVSKLIKYAFYERYANDSMISDICKIYNITAPIGYDMNKIRFIIRYFPFYYIMKGSSTALSIISLVGRTESDYYNDYNFGEISITFKYRGFYEISRAGLTDPTEIKFAQSLIDSVTRAGIYYKVVTSE